MTRCFLDRRLHNHYCRAWVLLLVGLLASLAPTTDAFVTAQPHLQNQKQPLVSPLLRFMAGFGGSSSSSSSSKMKKKMKPKKNKSDATTTTTSTSQPLRPRKQWGLFLGEDLKNADPIRVAVRVASRRSTDHQKWFEIGAVKSMNNAFTDAAVIRHRALITDHARRMFPTQIFAKDVLEFAYTTAIPTGESLKRDNTTNNSNDGGNEEWTVVGKIEQMPDDINNRIGFKGLPDPSGFYAFSEGTGLKAGDSTEQTNYLNMQVKGVTGHIQSN